MRFFEPAAALQTHVPLLRTIEKKLGRRITRADQTVEPVIADRMVADYLGMKPRAAAARRWCAPTSPSRARP